MNDDRQVCGACQLHLPHKDLLLHIARRVGVEIIQSDFAPGNYFGMPCQSLQFLEIAIGGQLGLVRMNANRSVKKLVLLRESNAAIERPRPISIADRDDGVDTGFSRARNHLLAIRLELLAFEMCVRINEHK